MTEKLLVSYIAEDINEYGDDEIIQNKPLFIANDVESIIESFKDNRPCILNNDECSTEPDTLTPDEFWSELYEDDRQIESIKSELKVSGNSCITLDYGSSVFYECVAIERIEYLE